MKEENALSQLQLTRAISLFRHSQLKAVDQAVVRLNCAGSTQECRTLAAVAIFLAYLGSRAEQQIAGDIGNAYRAMESMKQLPDQAQWEYRCAHTLGLCEGLNRIAVIQARIIEQAQACLHKASFLLMTEGGKTDLPAAGDLNRDYMETIFQDLNPKQGKRLGQVNELAVELSAGFLQKSMRDLNAPETSIASICKTAIDFTMADLMAALANYASEAVQFGEFLDDPARGARQQEYHQARLIAAGVVSALVIDVIRQHAPWVGFNLN
jgi:hypothetical protein